MERFHLEIELDDDDAGRVQAVLMANDMTMKQFGVCNSQGCRSSCWR